MSSRPAAASCPASVSTTAGALSPRDITTCRGIPVTKFARMLIDLTDVQRADELANVIHEGAFHGMFSELATRDAMALATGRHNLHVLEAALTLHSRGQCRHQERL